MSLSGTNAQPVNDLASEAMMAAFDGLFSKRTSFGAIKIRAFGVDIDTRRAACS